ncbi:PAS domain S-box-containing protein [Massilia sp. UYP11]|uniref:PAS domain S-box protein n=1 Tax=Massilia sp. UYP11 TaxID=1756385 RepID=UPI003D1A5AAD
MSRDPNEFGAEYEALIQFLYLAPVGLVQANVQGDVTMMNPVAAQLLMPLSHDGGLDNLFTALAGVAPELRERTARHGAPYGKVCDGLHVYLEAGAGAKRTPQILALTLLKLDPERVMAVIHDVTDQVRRERRLRQNDAWLNAILAGVQDYALVSLDLQGRICDWNPSIGRVTGFGPDAVGRPFTIFYPTDAIALEYRQDRLREADANGWSLDEGRRLRADGGVFWGSTLVAPLPERDPLPGEADGAAYCLILRDLGQPQEAATRFQENAHAA